MTPVYPPKMLLHGRADADVSFSAAERMAAALEEQGVAIVSFSDIPNSDHPSLPAHHILSSPNLTPAPTFPLPEFHCYLLKSPRTTMIPKPPNIKVFPAVHI